MKRFMLAAALLLSFAQAQNTRTIQADNMPRMGEPQRVQMTPQLTASLSAHARAYIARPCSDETVAFRFPYAGRVNRPQLMREVLRSLSEEFTAARANGEYRHTSLMPVGQQMMIYSSATSAEGTEFMMFHFQQNQMLLLACIL